MNPLERLELKESEVMVRVEKLEIVKRLLNTSMGCLDRRIKSYLKNSCLRQRADDILGHKLYSLLST